MPYVILSDHSIRKLSKPVYNAEMNPIIIATHNGGFHSDDVFAVATLHLALGVSQPISVVRTRDIDIINQADYVVDVGGQLDFDKHRYDHHQTEGAGTHANGIPYASFGLVWKEFGIQVSGSQEVAKYIEDKIVLFVDALDNGMDISTPLFEGVRPYTISDYFYSYWIDEYIEEDKVDAIFMDMVSLAKHLLSREIEKSKKIIAQRAEVESVYTHTEDRRVIVFDKNIAWGSVLVHKPEPLFVVYPSIDGTRWNAKAVHVKQNSFEVRKPFPVGWAGKSGEDLASVSGVPDAIFCHRALFLAVSESKEGALSMVHKALTY